jgi:hypothetical protein
MKTVVISQPMFLPWRGIFEQIALSDAFVFYDDVQLPHGGGQGRGFNTRVQIKNATGWQWLSVPVARPAERRDLINEVRFIDRKWRKKHLHALVTSYKRAPFFDVVYAELVEPIYGLETESLCDFCIESTTRIMNWLGLTPEIFVSSRMGIPAGIDASERVLLHCQRLEGTRYVSGKGGMNYLQHERFDAAGVSVAYMKYDLSPYPQLHGEFNPYVSIVDLLVHTGPEARAHLTSQARDWREWPELNPSR